MYLLDKPSVSNFSKTVEDALVYIILQYSKCYVVAVPSFAEKQLLKERKITLHNHVNRQISAVK